MPGIRSGCWTDGCLTAAMSGWADWYWVTSGGGRCSCWTWAAWKFWQFYFQNQFNFTKKKINNCKIIFFRAIFFFTWSSWSWSWCCSCLAVSNSWFRRSISESFKRTCCCKLAKFSATIVKLQGKTSKILKSVNIRYSNSCF